MMLSFLTAIKKKGAKFGIAPKVLSRVVIVIFRFGNDNDPADGYAYWTQVADKSKTPSMAALEKLEKKMEQHGFDTGDICSRNTGFVKNKLVCIDFCPASMC